MTRCPLHSSKVQTQVVQGVEAQSTPCFEIVLAVLCLLWQPESDTDRAAGAYLRSCRQCRPRAISYATFLPRSFHWKMRCPALLVRGSWSHSVPFSM